MSAAELILPEVDPFYKAEVYLRAQASHYNGQINVGAFNGDKFPGGFGAARWHGIDYWELREKSAQLFEQNLYARGLLRRLVTSIINTGLMLYAEPDSNLIPGIDDIEAEDWSESVESRFEIYSESKEHVDFERTRTLAQLQAIAKLEAYIEGDILVVLHTNTNTGVPEVELIKGSLVHNPFDISRTEENTWHGVKLNSRNEPVGFWVNNPLTQESRFIKAKGSRSGKRVAWLVYGTDKRMDQIRGVPMLGLIMQSVRDLDRMRDYEIQASSINAMFAVWVENKDGKKNSMPFSGGARPLSSSIDSVCRQDFTIAQQYPGVAMEGLQQGEIPHSFKTERPNVNYGNFEGSIVQAVAWANEIPPEVLMLAFNSNYSASRAAQLEFLAFVMKERKNEGTNFCQPIYQEWLVGEILSDSIRAPGFIEARMRRSQYVLLGAWYRATWHGPVKPSIDLAKDVGAFVEAIENGLMTKDAASTALFGVRYSRVLKRREKEIRAEQAMRETLGLAPIEPEPTEGQQRRTDARALLRLVRQEIDERSADDGTE